MPKVSTLSQKLKSIKKPSNEPVWRGPSGEGPQGGVTQGALARYVVCPERFRIRMVEGLQPVDTFNHRLEYGNMWHVCEEVWAKGPSIDIVNLKLKEYCQSLCARYRLQQDEINHWYNVCRKQFPLYVAWWARHDDVKQRTPLLQEQTFDVPYQLPSGRTVRLRGKWDSVDLIGKQIWLQENKSKGNIEGPQIVRQLQFDLQTMLYLIALEEGRKDPKIFIGDTVEIKNGKRTETKHPIAGVRYNVVRRPLAGGKGSIRQKKNQTLPEFYDELSGIIESAVGEEWGCPSGEHFFFMRWKVEISQHDIDRFKTEFLNPCLENLCNHYDVWSKCYKMGVSPFDASMPERLVTLQHYRLPFGIYNVLAEGGSSDLDEYLLNGNTTGLQRATNLFPELQSNA